MLFISPSDEWYKKLLILSHDLSRAINSYKIYDLFLLFFGRIDFSRMYPASVFIQFYRIIFILCFYSPEFFQQDRDENPLTLDTQ